MHFLLEKHHLYFTKNYSILLIKLLIFAITIIGFNGCGNPSQNQTGKSQQIHEISQEGSKVINHLKIEPVEPYIFQIQFHQNPQQQFRFWFPEVVLFNNDYSRAEIEDDKVKAWFEKTSDGYSVSGKIGIDQMQVSFKYEIKPISEEEIGLWLEIKNIGKLPWSDYAQLAACLAPDNKAFSDKDGGRTFINTKNSILHSIKESGIVEDFNHYPVTPRNDLADSVQRVRVASGFVARLSTDEHTNISFFWPESARVDVNPGGLDCIHSHPAIGPLKPGETIVRKGFILLKAGTVQESYKDFREQF